MEYLVIDTESCTGKSNDGSLCSIGYAICDEKLHIIKKEDILFNPLPNWFSVGDKKHAKRTGVTFAYPINEFRHSPRFSIEYTRVKTLFDGRIVLGFSMANDIKYLNDACDKFNLDRIEYRFLDIQFIYTLLYPEVNSIGLKTLSEKYQIEYIEHRSDEDAVVSVLILKAFLNEMDTSLSNMIEKFGVHYGINDKNGYYMNYADAIINEEYGLRLSKKIQGVILSDYLRKLPQQKGKKQICLSSKIEHGEINRLRSLIDCIYKNGMTITHSHELCDIYVMETNDYEKQEEINNKISHPVEIYNLNDFEKLVGFDGIKKYDDTDFLISYFTQKKI